MASPLHDANAAKLRRKVFDDSAGVEVTDALANDYLNRANRFIQIFLWNMDKSDDKTLVQRKLSGLVNTQAITWSGAGAAVATDYAFPIFALYVDGSAAYHPLYYTEPSVYLKSIPNLTDFKDNVFLIFGGKTYGYYQGSNLTSGTGAIYYIKNDQRASLADSSDIAIDSIWYDVLVDLAATYHFEDKGQLSFAQAQEKRAQIVLSMVQ